MRNLPLRILAVFILLVDTPALAAPTVSIQWGDCSSPPGMDRYNRYDPTSTSDLASVTIQGVTGTIKAVAFNLRLWSGGSSVPGAWRYDSNGCSAGSLRMGVLSGDCTALTAGHRLEATRIEQFTYSGPAWINGLEVIRYEAGFDVFTANPNTLYTVAQVDFGHLNAALEQCGCLERPLCIGLDDVHYIDGLGSEYVVLTYAEGIRWNDPFNVLQCPPGPDLCTPDCVWEADTLCVAATPAVQRSWGNLKASYR